MKNDLKILSKIIPIKKFIVFASLLFLFVSILYGLKLRRIGYYIIPEPYAIADEHTNVWHGLSLRKNGIPVAWSQLGAYGASGVMGEVRGMKIYVDNKSTDLKSIKNFPNPVTALLQLDIGKGLEHVRFVQPYIDHPPLGAIILSLGVTKPVNSFPDLSAHDMRRMSVYLAVVTTLLIFAAGWQLTGNPLIGLVASMVYGSAPTFILLSRYAQLENVLSPMFLIVFNLILLLKKKLPEKINTTVLITAGVFAGFCALTKEIGWFALLFGVITLLLWKKKPKDIITFTVPAVCVGSLYFFWCWYLNPELFKNIFIYQGISREFVGSLNMIAAFIRVGILNFPLDGWWLGGFLVLILIAGKKEYLPLYVASCIIIFTNLFLGGANYAWYYIPLIPFMCIAIAIFFHEIATSPKFTNIMLFFLIFFSSSFYWGYGASLAISQAAGYRQPFALYRISFLIFLACALFFLFRKNSGKVTKIWHMAGVLIFVILLLLNIKSVYFLQTNWGSGIYPSLYSPGSGFIMK